jgi:hypothetical protein
MINEGGEAVSSRFFRRCVNLKEYRVSELLPLNYSDVPGRMMAPVDFGKISEFGGGSDVRS